MIPFVAVIFSFTAVDVTIEIQHSECILSATGGSNPGNRNQIENYFEDVIFPFSPNFISRIKTQKLQEKNRRHFRKFQVFRYFTSHLPDFIPASYRH